MAKEGAEENAAIKEKNAVTNLSERNIDEDNDRYDGKRDKQGFRKSCCQSHKQEKVDENISQIVVTAAQESHMRLKHSLNEQCHPAKSANDQ